MSNPKSPSAEHPHLVSLVLESEKALQHGQQVCARAQERYNASAQEAVDVLALDAKLHWISNAILEQLKVRLAIFVTSWRLTVCWLLYLNAVGSGSCTVH
jgi:autophagy-related protein 17